MFSKVRPSTPALTLALQPMKAFSRRSSPPKERLHTSVEAPTQTPQYKSNIFHQARVLNLEDKSPPGSNNLDRTLFDPDTSSGVRGPCWRHEPHPIFHLSRLLAYLALLPRAACTSECSIDRLTTRMCRRPLHVTSKQQSRHDS
jgi:hypothetical protein